MDGNVVSESLLRVVSFRCLVSLFFLLLFRSVPFVCVCVCVCVCFFVSLLAWFLLLFRLLAVFGIVYPIELTHLSHIAYKTKQNGELHEARCDDCPCGTDTGTLLSPFFFVHS